MIRCLVIQAFTPLRAVILIKAQTFYSKAFCWLFPLLASRPFNETFWTEVPAIKFTCSSAARMGIWWQYNSFIYLMILMSAWVDKVCFGFSKRRWGPCQVPEQLFRWTPAMPGTAATDTATKQEVFWGRMGTISGQTRCTTSKLNI